MVNTYAVQSGGCRFESLWGFGFFLKGAHYEVDYSGKKTYLAGLQCTLTSSCAKIIEGGPFEDIEKLSHSDEKSGNILLRNACKKIRAYAWFKHERCGLRSKHLTTRPRTPELYELRAETRVVARKRSTHIFP